MLYLSNELGLLLSLVAASCYAGQIISHASYSGQRSAFLIIAALHGLDLDIT